MPIRAVGVEILLGSLVSGHGSLGAQMILVCGCDDSQVIHQLADHVAGVHAIDPDPDVVQSARNALSMEIDAGQVEIHEANLDELPYEDQSFDAVVVTGRVDHLHDSAASGWEQHQALITEATRVLSPGGVLVMITVSRPQLEKSFWHRHLIPRASDELTTRHAPISAIRSMLEDAGLKCGGHYVPLSDSSLGPDYLTPVALDQAEWLRLDPAWALTTEEERSEASDLVDELLESGALADFISSHDEMRPSLGQITVLDARLPGD